MIDRHLSEAKTAGIDTLVCSWWGQHDATDRAIRRLMERAPAHGLTICILWERLTRSQDKASATTDLAYLLQTFGNNPGTLRVHEKPVLFLYSDVCHGLSPEDWAEVLTQTEKRFLKGFLAIGTGSQSTDARLWDGLFSLEAAPEMPEHNPVESAKALKEAASVSRLLVREAGHICVETVLPGYQESKPNAASEAPKSKHIDRQEGALYRALWNQALDDNPDWILISSFNQWHNGTEIEPSVEMGGLYLKLTQGFTARFKQTTGK